MPLTCIKRCSLIWIWVSTCFTFLVGQQATPIQLITDRNHAYLGCLAIDTTKIEPFLEVFSERPSEASLPMLGKLHREADQHYFIPRFPFLQGHTYWLKWRRRAGPIQSSSIQIPFQEPLSAPAVEAIYPSTDQWPANQLKFYLLFDQPMREGVALQYIELLDQTGEVVERPFLEMGQELWDQEHKQLTVWFDPGRIKTGLIPNEQFGPPMHKDRFYQLRIKRGFPAKNDKILLEDKVKRFQTKPKDKKRPNPSQWQLSLPTSGTRQPLIVQFPDPLDYSLLKRAIWVEDNRGNRIAGHAEIGRLEKSWQLTPAIPWTGNLYRLKVDKDLEDLAGNNLDRLFDTAVSKTGTDEKQIINSIAFRLKPQE